MDQHGDLVSLSDFDGKIVVLTFMDSQCKDVCPLTAAQLRQAHQHLNQDEANQVVFIAVNVSVEANMAEDVLLATQKWHLDEIPHWHFLTGSAEELTPIWNAYNVAVVSREGGEIIHTPGIFLIDKNQQKRWYISTPYTAEGTTETTLPLNELLVKHIREILREK
jgi:cytochrome oxidase Cu insertion factor (SCO1/SenC/PrrC family)